MHYAIDELANETQVQFFGEIDLATAGEMLDTLTQTILDSPWDRVVVDLAEVPLLDATAVGALVAARTIAAHRGRTLVIANPTRMVRQVLVVTGAMRVLMAPEQMAPEQMAPGPLAPERLAPGPQQQPD